MQVVWFGGDEASTVAKTDDAKEVTIKDLYERLDKILDILGDNKKFKAKGEI